jgi:hypothetical protein
VKNIVPLVDRDDIHDYVGRLWKTEIFQESHRNGGFVYKLVDQFAWLPRLFAEESNDRLERAHFSTWWNVIMIRDDYSNPFIHDLYYLHEMAHAATMPYVPGIGRAAFDEKMQRNELEASVLSEIQVYFEMPNLRKSSFDHVIYADRFLNRPEMRGLWEGNPRVAIETIRSMRRDVMVSKPEELLDNTEKWIRRFALQNDAYSITWAENYNEVECAMARLQYESAFDRDDALKVHVDWLAENSTDGIPFKEEAELFTPFYWANKARYEAAMKDAA